MILSWNIALSLLGNSILEDEGTVEKILHYVLGLCHGYDKRENKKWGQNSHSVVFYPMGQTVLGLDLQEVNVDETAPKRGGRYLLSEDEAIPGSGHVSPTLCDDTLEKVKNHLNSWIYEFKLHIRMTALKNL